MAATPLRKENQIMTANLHTARVGFIGLGDQGAPMAQAIGDSGFGLHVWARRPQSLDVLARTRHTVHDSPASLAAAVDILALCLRDDRDIWEVLGTPGVEDALRPGLILVNHGTGDPGENREIAGHLAGKRVAYWPAWTSSTGRAAPTQEPTTRGPQPCRRPVRASNSPTRRSTARCP
jgi:3-hydroxyisobutyrate dehydrogenase-like beta-hydroxyacid dehydrogenase